MKNTKRFLLLLLAFILCLSFAACGGDDPCTEHKDDDGNLICDVCGTQLEDDNGDDGVLSADELTLISDGKANFRIVKGSDVSSSVSKKISDLSRNLEKLGIEVSVVFDSEAADADQIYEVSISRCPVKRQIYMKSPFQSVPDCCIHLHQTVFS